MVQCKWSKSDPITEWGSAEEGDSQFQSETWRRISKAEEKHKRGTGRGDRHIIKHKSPV